MESEETKVASEVQTPDPNKCDIVDPADANRCDGCE